MKKILSTALLIILASWAGAQDDRAAALAAAQALPDGPQKEAIIKALKAAGMPVEEPSFLDSIGVDQNGEWQNAELKKAQVAELFAGMDEVPLKDGRQVKVASVTTLTPRGLRWIGEGIEEAHWSLLPEPMVKTLGFTQARQSAYEAWKKQADFAGAAAVASQNRQMAAQMRESAARRSRLDELMKSRVAVSLRVSQALPDGCLCYGARIESSPYWGRWEGLRWVNGLVAADEHDEPIYVIGLPATTVDGDRTAGWLYPCGVYRYKAVSGAQKAVRQYATSAERALELLDSGE